MIHYWISVLVAFCLGLLLAAVLWASAQGDRLERAHWRRLARTAEDVGPELGFGGVIGEGYAPGAPD